MSSIFKAGGVMYDVPYNYGDIIPVARTLMPENLPDNFRASNYEILKNNIINYFKTDESHAYEFNSVISKEEILNVSRDLEIIDGENLIAPEKLGSRKGFELPLPLRSKDQKMIFDFFHHSAPDINIDKAADFIEMMHRLKLNPGNFNWKFITSWGGPIFDAIKKVDYDLIHKSYPLAPNSFAITLQKPMNMLVVGALLSLSYVFMTTGISIPFFGDFFGFPAPMWMATVYLFMNAASGIISDKLAQHGSNPKLWISDTYIDWTKVGIASITTSLAYPILSTIKAGIKGGISIPNLEDPSNPTIIPPLFDDPFFNQLATPVILGVADGIYTFGTRMLRGFGLKTALLDSLRPSVGNIFAIFLSLGIPSVYTQNLQYFLASKTGSVTWSGILEYHKKRNEETKQRSEIFSKIFNENRYNVPDPQAMMAMNFVHLVKDLPSSNKIWNNFMEFAGNIENRADKFSKLNEILEDKNRIDDAIAFIFPFNDQIKHREYLREIFEVDRDNYFRKRDEYLIDFMWKIQQFQSIDKKEK